MDFYKLVKSLDDLVFEILSWLYFYPRTLLRTLFRPFALMRDTEAQMEEDDEPAFGDRIGPPLFLALTLGLIHVVEMGMGIEAAEDFHNEAIRELMSDDRNLLALRIILFGGLPLLAAARQLKAQDRTLSKSMLKAPFYAQCYAAAGYAVLFNAAYFSGHAFMDTHQEMAAGLLFGGLLVAAVWIGWVEARWFHRVLGVGRWKAFRHALVLLVQWFALFVLLTLPF
ncbi:hypothetical protein [Sphingomicrobium arenosum]|uniref:hypothetical protein n=1 Tax=Sphingomicrobium arenosum TaxID=2233861 RepID=UPI0022405904|nr:hypothetical protein [Sphingomicrobium arenosum]